MNNKLDSTSSKIITVMLLYFVFKHCTCKNLTEKIMMSITIFNYFVKTIIETEGHTRILFI